MKSIMKMRMFRAAVVFVCGAGLFMSAAVAQQDATPPPADGQQQGPPPGGRQGMDPGRRAQMLQRRLDLSADQTTQVVAILTHSQAKMEELRANTTLSEQDRRAQFGVLRQEQVTKIRAVLSPDQQAKYDALEARRREHRGGDGQDGSGPPQPQTPQ